MNSNTKGNILGDSNTNCNNYKICYNCKQYCNAQDIVCGNCGARFDYVQYQQPYVGQVQYAQQYYNPQRQTSFYIKPYSLSGFIFAVIGLVLSMISVFLPYVQIDAYGFKDSRKMFGNSSDSYVILVFSFLGLIVLLCRCKTYTVDVMLAGITFLYIAIYHYMHLSEDISDSGELRDFLEIGAGLHLLLFASILIIIGGITLFAYKKKLNS